MGLLGKAVFIVILAISLGLFAWAVSRRMRVLWLGQPENRFDRPAQRVKSLLVYVIGQRKVIEDPYPGLMHVFIFWGFLVLGLGELQIFGEGLFPGFSLPLLGGSAVFYLVQDLFGVLVLLGIAMAAWRRYVIKPDRLDKSTDAAVILSLITGVVITFFVAEGLRGSINPEHLELAFVTGSLAGWLAGQGFDPGLLQTYYYLSWWVHVLIILAFLVFIPHSKHMHLIASPFNVYFRMLEPIGKMLRPVDFENEQDTLGVNKIKDFTWKQLLDCYSCTQCGRCQDNCPAYLSGRPLSPKKFINNLKECMVEYGKNKGLPPGQAGPDSRDVGGDHAEGLIGRIVTDKEIWSCTTCGACQYNCPVLNEHVPKMVDLRRYLAMEETAYPTGVDNAMRSLESRGHPYRGTLASRGNWYKGTWVEETVRKDGEVLFWVGCTTALDERNMKIARAFAELLRRAGINFSILGGDERCCGDPARHLGNEYLYENMVRGNIEMLRGFGAQTIVTTCPHCFNIFKNEYPRFGENFSVYHHTEFLARLIRDQRLVVRSMYTEIITYHDPCYLGRYNNIFTDPRDILRTMGTCQLAEMQRTRGKSFCCGGGGGGAWMEDEGSNRINHLRADQALATDATTVCTACPFCMTMLNDGVKAKQDGTKKPVKVLDIAEIMEIITANSDNRGAKI